MLYLAGFVASPMGRRRGFHARRPVRVRLDLTAMLLKNRTRRPQLDEGNSLPDASHPLPQALLLFAIGLVWLIIRRYRTGAVFCLLGVAWFGLCATPAFVARMREGLEVQHPPQPVTSYPTADAIVVFGGDSVPGDEPGWDAAAANIASRRIGYAYQLYQAGRAPVIVLAGGQSGAPMAAALEKQGIPADALRIERQSGNTYEDAYYASLILKREHRLRVLLVTSPIHMPRALAALGKQGIDATAAPTIELPTTDAPPHPWLPQAAALLQSRLYLHEYIGLWFYRVRGWA
jgi:uncharacterized SAM-binding protein YcdF (DUF218 family)